MLVHSLVLAPVFAACAFGQLPAASVAFSINYSFPPTGLSSSETAQVNVLNTAAAATTTGAAAPSCAGSISFKNTAGTTIASEPFTTTGSQIISTQLAFSKVGATGNRGEFVASVQLTSMFPAAAPCSLVFSLETFDNASGATHIFLANSAATAGVGRLPPVLPF